MRMWASRDDFDSEGQVYVWRSKPQKSKRGHFFIDGGDDPSVLYGRLCAALEINLNPGECREIEPIQLVRKAKKRSVKRGKA